jgi:hypothetical protein
MESLVETKLIFSCCPKATNGSSWSGLKNSFGKQAWNKKRKIAPKNKSHITA